VYLEATAQLDTACVQFENGDWETAAEVLQAALGAVGEDVPLQNRLCQQGSGTWRCGASSRD
jgi:hypothetical protein